MHCFIHVPHLRIQAMQCNVTPYTSMSFSTNNQTWYLVHVFLWMGFYVYVFKNKHCCLLHVFGWLLPSFLLSPNRKRLTFWNFTIFPSFTMIEFRIRELIWGRSAAHLSWLRQKTDHIMTFGPTHGDYIINHNERKPVNLNCKALESLNCSFKLLLRAYTTYMYICLYMYMLYNTNMHFHASKMGYQTPQPLRRKSQ